MKHRSSPHRPIPGEATVVQPPPRGEARPVPAGDEQLQRWLMQGLRILAVVLLALWCYSPATNGTWLWDDDQSVTQNPVAKSPYSFTKIWITPLGEALAGMKSSALHALGLGPAPPPPKPVNFGEADYWPLTATGFWLEWHAFGEQPGGYHVVNALLHAVGALLVWRLMTVMNLPGGWFAGLLFAVHPLAVETVTWVSELKNVLSLPLMLLSAIHFIRADDARAALARHDAPGTEAVRRRGPTAAGPEWRPRIDYGLSPGWFVLAMFAKTSVVMLPPVLLLYAWWKRGRIGLGDILFTAPFFAISLFFGLVTIYFQHGRAIGTETMLVGGLWSRLAIAGMAVPFYLGKVLLPFGLMPIYPRWEVDPPKIVQFLPIPVMAAAVAYAWMNRASWGRHVLFALGFFLLMLLPVLGFITISYMRITWVADHFVYAPMIGPLVLVAAAAASLTARVGTRERRWLLGAAAVLVGMLAIGSFRYSFAWADEDPMWTYTLMRHAVPCRQTTCDEPRVNGWRRGFGSVHFHPCRLTHCGCWQANSRLGARKYSQGKMDDAFFHFSESVRLRPDLAETHNNYGNSLAARGRIDEAVKEFRTASEIQPQLIVFQNNLAMTLMQSGRIEQARDVFKTMLEQWPEDPTLHNNYAFALHRLGDSAGAIASLQRAIAINPNYEEAKKNLAMIREEASKAQSRVNPLGSAERPDPAAATGPAAAPTSPTMAAPSPGLGAPLPGIGGSSLGPAGR